MKEANLSKKVIVVIVNWNRKEILRNLLVSLEKIDYNIYKKIVVDNASTDDSVEMIKKEFSDILLVENDENLGGTGGFNTGLKKAMEFDSDYVWLLDNDVEVENDALCGLVQIGEEDEKIAVIGSTVCYLIYRDYIYEAGGYFNWRKGILKPNQRNVLYDRKRMKRSYDVDYCAACSMLVRTSLLPRIGIMDDNFFLTGDDLEWTYRFKRHGYRVVTTPLSRVYHASKVVVSSTYMYYSCRNTFYLFLRHASGRIARFSSLFFNLFLYSFILEEAKYNRFKDLETIYAGAFKDTFSKKMGKCTLESMSFEKKKIKYKKEIIEGLKGKILVNCVDVEDEVIIDIFNVLKDEGDTKLLIRNDKLRLPDHKEYTFNYDYKSLSGLVKLILWRKFDWAICFEEQRGTCLASLLSNTVITLNKDGTVGTNKLSKIGFFNLIFKSFFHAVKGYFKV